MEFINLYEDDHFREHTIGASDDDMEAIPPLAFVVRLPLRHWGTPDSALVIGRACRVGTIVNVRVDAGITFDVHIESFATVRAVTQGCTCERVKALQGVEGHVFRGTE